MLPEELEWLAFEASRHKVVVEIGSYLGRSGRAMGDNCPGVVYCVDHFDGPVETEDLHVESRDDIWPTFKRNMKDLMDSGKVKACPQTSMEGAQMWQKYGLKADMVFIDGSHDLQSVVDDVREWSKVLNPGGLLCGHDSHWPGVAEMRRTMLPPHMSGVGGLWAVDNFRGLVG